MPTEARKYIESAVHDARERKPRLESACFDFVADVLLIAERPHLNPDQREARLSFVLRWQQSTGPIVAKGQEDTALYVYYPLLSLNEVGSDPQPSKAPSASDFVQFVRNRQMNWPHSMNARPPMTPNAARMCEQESARFRKFQNSGERISTRGPTATPSLKGS